jgi:hypothetical protein
MDSDFNRQKSVRPLQGLALFFVSGNPEDPLYLAFEAKAACAAISFEGIILNIFVIYFIFSREISEIKVLCTHENARKTVIGAGNGFRLS